MQNQLSREKPVDRLGYHARGAIVSAAFYTAILACIGYGFRDYIYFDESTTQIVQENRNKQPSLVELIFDLLKRQNPLQIE
jgi:hypothetical protein